MPTKTKPAAKTAARKTGKSNIMDKVNRERGKAAPPAPTTSAAQEPEKEPTKAEVEEDRLLQMAAEEIQNDATSNTAVGNIFKFPQRERDLFNAIGEKVSGKATTVSRGIAELHVETRELDLIRSRWLLVKKLFKDHPDVDDEIVLPPNIRKAMGHGLSYHMRELNKLEKNMSLNLVEDNDLEKARELTQHVANKIGTQIEMFLKVEDGA